MLPVLQIGPLALPTAPLLLMLGVWAGTWLAEREAARLGLSADTVAGLVLVMLAAGLLGARLGYAARYLGIYAADPLSLLSPNPATLDARIGLIAAGLAGLLDGRRRGLPLWRTLDALAPALAALALAVGVAHLASGDAFGAPANLPWSIYLWEEWRHPSQLYEIGAALLAQALWWRLRRHAPFDGFGMLVLLALLAGARLFLEAFRGDSWLLPGGWRGAQLAALGVLALCLWLIGRRAMHNDKVTR